METKGVEMRGWKFTKPDGTDHYSGTVNYRENIGKVMEHPSPTQSKNPCGEGYHLGKTLKGAGKYATPGAVFRCEYSRKDVLGEDEYKVRVSRLKVIEEVPAWKGYGPRGKQVQKFIGSLSDVPWFKDVGEPFEKPEWAEKMEMVSSWAAAWAAARAAAWAAAGDAAEIMGGIKDGHFAKLMEVYRAGHCPCSLDGKKLVVY